MYKVSRLAMLFLQDGCNIRQRHIFNLKVACKLRVKLVSELLAIRAFRFQHIF